MGEGGGEGAPNRDERGLEGEIGGWSLCRGWVQVGLGASNEGGGEGGKGQGKGRK